MKSLTIKFMSVFIIATFLFSTVAMASEGYVNVYEETPDILGLGEVSQSVGNVLWGNLDLSDRVPNVVKTSDSVLNFKNHNTAKQAMVVTGFIIPKESKTGFSFQHDDGIKVFIKNQDGSELVTQQNWILTGETTMTFTQTLEMNKVYSIRIEYFDWGGTEVLKTDLPMNWFHDSVPVHTITYMDGDSEFASNTVAHGLTATDIAGPSKVGFQFAGWNLGDSSFDFSTPIISDLTLVATWTPITEDPKEEDPKDEEPVDEQPITSVPVTVVPQVVNYNLTVVTTEGGSVPGFEGTNIFSAGTNVNLSAVPEEGYRFIGWTGDVNNNVVVMNESKTVTANFELIIEDEIVAQSPDVAEEVTSVEQDNAVEVVTEVILDETTPEEAAVTLPETSGVAAPIFYAMGTAIVGFGLTLKKRK